MDKITNVYVTVMILWGTDFQPERLWITACDSFESRL